MGVQQRKEKAPLDCGSQVTSWDELTGNRDEGMKKEMGGMATSSPRSLPHHLCCESQATSGLEAEEGLLRTF